ncbi:MAG TPA: septum formation family protein [Acidimicrobiales bacterium]
MPDGSARGMSRIGIAAIAAALLLTCACSGGGGPGRDKNGQVTSPGDLSVFDLRVGDCFTPSKDVKAEIESVHVVPCKDSHTQESFALVQYDKGDTYPGDSELGNFADGACLARYQDYVGVNYLDSKLFYTYLLPSARSWNDGKDRKVVCIITTTGDSLTSSVKGSQR